MYIVDGEGRIYGCRVVDDPRIMKTLSTKISFKILEELSSKPSTLSELSSRLSLTMQRLSYHLKRLVESGLVEYTLDDIGGRKCKVYRLKHSGILVLPPGVKPIGRLSFQKIEAIPALYPFIENGSFNAIIVIGSPDPHGRYGYAASDGYSAIDLALFLGSFVNRSVDVAYKLDTQVTATDKAGNLILVGGPKSNMLTDEVNRFLPISFEYSENLRDWTIYSPLSGRRYIEKHIGLIARIENPFSTGKVVLVLAGKGFRGTRAAIVGFIKYPDRILEGNIYNSRIKCRVVRGLDIDSDGIIDDVEFVE
ncbi:MAG: helix-turn-helix domain-containing protein [Nitrososphaerota archaeon]|nr:helix-turn-helix domain-containing protein [Candidatus Bathyarchaeota archaeon]MCX8162712.1 helix-turn-helix domain-containing protein [Candidatus Bathyarchaeota archaeon]MDW8061905.1 helix-turn-helix domain-containing protein [Nitrososphaerota archaeon]